MRTKKHIFYLAIPILLFLSTAVMTTLYLHTFNKLNECRMEERVDVCKNDNVETTIKKEEKVEPSTPICAGIKDGKNLDLKAEKNIFPNCNTKEGCKECRYLLSLESGKTVLVEIKAEDIDSDDEPDENQYGLKVFFDNQEVWKAHSPMFSRVHNIKVWGDLILVHYITNTGCGDHGELVVYDSSFKEKLHYGGSGTNIDEEFSTLAGYEIFILDTAQEIEIRAENWGPCVTMVKYKDPSGESPYDMIDLYDENILNILPRNYVIEGKYEIQYDKNKGIFSKPSRTVILDLETALKMK